MRLCGRSINSPLTFSCNRSTTSKKFFSSSRSLHQQPDGLVLGIYQDGSFTLRGKQLSDSLKKSINWQLDLSKVKGKLDQKALVFVPQNDQTPERIAVVGLGDTAETNKIEVARRASSIGVKTLKNAGAQKIAVEDFDGNTVGASEGAILGSWSFSMKTAREEQEDNINNNDTEVFPWDAKGATNEEWKTGKTMAEAQNWARTLAETPSNLMTPTIFVERVLEKFNQLNNQNVAITVYDEQWMVEKKMGCLLGVAQGSNQAPKFLQIRYKGAKNTRPLAFVGKGVTFDSGGISIKPSAGMGEMKGDMGGAAAVVSAIWGIAALGIDTDIVCLVPLCENMPSGRAIKPGDVLVAMNGKTVEVDNTDAEGRLILADALHFAHSFQPQAIIDVATLTGAIDVALGSACYGTFTNDDNLWKSITDASSKSGEEAWRMPFSFRQYKSAIKSRIADVVNSTNRRSAGSCTAAAFLGEFVSHPSWAHLDIAGVMKADHMDIPYLPKGMSGMPTRTLIHLAKNSATQK